MLLLNHADKPLFKIPYEIVRSSGTIAKKCLPSVDVSAPGKVVPRGEKVFVFSRYIGDRRKAVHQYHHVYAVLCWHVVSNALNLSNALGSLFPLKFGVVNPTIQPQSLSGSCEAILWMNDGIW